MTKHLLTKQHIVAFFLLAFICLPTCTFISLQISKLIAKHEMLERLEHSNLEEITLAKKDVQWYEEGEEIVVGSDLFDVKFSKVKSDSVVFRGLFDRKESLLKKNIDQLIDYQNKKSSSNNLTIAQLVFQLWYHSNNDYTISRPGNNFAHLNSRAYKDNLSTSGITPPSPPPRNP